MVTLDYRAPELLLGDCNNTRASCGYVVSLLYHCRAVRNRSYTSRSHKTTHAHSDNYKSDIWPEVADLPVYDMLELPVGQPTQFHSVFAGFHKAEVDVINSLLQLKCNLTGLLGKTFCLCCWIAPFTPLSLPKDFLENNTTQLRKQQWHKFASCALQDVEG